MSNRKGCFLKKSTPPWRRCITCNHFLRKEDQHAFCILHRPCHRDNPCDLDRDWDVDQWDEFEHVIAIRQQGKQAKDEENASSPGMTVNPPLLVNSTDLEAIRSPEFLDIVKSSVAAAVHKCNKKMPQVTVGEVLPNGALRISKVHNKTTRAAAPKYQEEEMASPTESEVEDASEEEEDPSDIETSEEDYSTSSAKTRKRPSSQRNLLPTKKRPRGAKWFPSETKALVEFLAIRNDLWDRLNSTSVWPYSQITDPLWMKAACYISEQTGQPIRTGSSVRSQVVKDLNVRFPVVKGGLSVALKAYNITPPEGYQPTPPTPPPPSQSEFDWKPLVTPSDRIEAAMEVLEDLDASDKLCFLDRFVDTMDVETVKTLKEKLNQKIDTLVGGLAVPEFTNDEAKT